MDLNTQIFFINQDLLNDAKCSREQSENGPYFPERGITKESLIKYAEECEFKVRRNNAKIKEIAKESIRHTLRSASPFPIWNYA